MKKTKKKVYGVTFNMPLEFSDWPIDRLEKIIANTKEEYDLSNYELDFVNRGGYQKCQGYDSHEPCDELIETFGKIVWKSRPSPSVSGKDI